MPKGKGEAKGKGKFTNKPAVGANDDEDGLQVLLQGDGVALGEDTLTWIDADLTIKDLGKVTIAKGFLVIGAAADGSEEDLLLALTDGDAVVFGAEGVRIKETTWSFADEDSTYELTVLKVFSIDRPGMSGQAKYSYVEKQMNGPELSFPLNGNKAALKFDVLAAGESTSVSVDAFALAIEDALSQSSILIVGGVA